METLRIGRVKLFAHSINLVGLGLFGITAYQDAILDPVLAYNYSALLFGAVGFVFMHVTAQFMLAAIGSDHKQGCSMPLINKYTIVMAALMTFMIVLTAITPSLLWALVTVLLTSAFAAGVYGLISTSK